MSNILKSMSVVTLKRAAEIREQIDGLEAELARLAGGAAPSAAATAPVRKGTMSPEGRARVAAAQRRRWAKVKAGQKPAPKAKAKRKMSPEGRARIVAAQKARWAKVKAAQQAQA